MVDAGGQVTRRYAHWMVRKSEWFDKDRRDDGFKRVWTPKRLGDEWEEEWLEGLDLIGLGRLIVLPDDS